MSFLARNSQNLEKNYKITAVEKMLIINISRQFHIKMKELVFSKNVHNEGNNLVFLEILTVCLLLITFRTCTSKVLWNLCNIVRYEKADKIYHVSYEFLTASSILSVNIQLGRHVTRGWNCLRPCVVEWSASTHNRASLMSGDQGRPLMPCLFVSYRSWQ